MKALDGVKGVLPRRDRVPYGTEEADEGPSAVSPVVEESVGVIEPVPGAYISRGQSA